MGKGKRQNPNQQTRELYREWAVFRRMEECADWTRITPDWLGLDYHLLHGKDSGHLALLNAGQRACVSDCVNEKRLEDLQMELAEGENPGEWSFLLPWEKARLPPGADRKRAADDMLHACMQRHGI